MKVKLGIISLILSITGILASSYYYHSDLNKKLSHLIQRDSGTLTFNQAKDLTNLYIYAIQREMHIGIRELVKNELPYQLARGDVTGSKRSINITTDKVISETRNKVARFKINGNQSFKDFLDTVNPIDGDIILKAKEDAFLLVKKAYDKKTSIDNLSSELFLITEQAGSDSAKHINKELSKLYN